MIVGLVGLAGSGKDTVADMLVQDHDFTKVALADPLKRIAREVYAFTEDQLWGPSARRNAPDVRYPRKWGDGEIGATERMVPVVTEYLTPRYALQKLGTEWGRDCFENTWIELGIRIAKDLLNPLGGKAYDARMGVFSSACQPPRGVVFSDCRFMNEIDAVKRAGGKVIRIVREGAGLAGAAGLHPSEAEQASIPDRAFDMILVNNGDSLGELRKAVAALRRSL